LKFYGMMALTEGFVTYIAIVNLGFLTVFSTKLSSVILPRSENRRSKIAETLYIVN